MPDTHEHRPDQDGGYPLHTLVAIIPPAARDTALAALKAAGVQDAQIDVALGAADAQRVAEASEGGFFGRLAASLALEEEQPERQRYVEALQGGEAVIRVHLDDESQKAALGELLAAQGGSFINYFGRWTVEALAP